ncbi:MAG TPA: C-GCAxxG-C-C family (seleno)protein [Myxococcales bacterium]|jgi:C_GCAxxG_C_C family probable redox protein
MGSDLIIIGAGMAGLSAGCYAQMNGYRSQIFESHALPGGLCAAWKRGGYVFDTSIHMLMSSTSGMFHSLWRDLGIVQGRQFAHRDVVLHVETMGKKVDVFADLDRLERELLALSPGDADRIRELIRMAHQLTRFELPLEKPRELWGPLDHLKQLRTMALPRGILRRADWSIQGFASQCQDPSLAEVVRLLIDSPGWPMPEAPLISALAVLGAYHERNAGAPLGGSFEVAQAVAKRYRTLGGSIHFNSKVQTILVEHDRAVGVRLADGTEHRADAVLSAADGRATIFDMLSGRYASPEIRRAYAEWKVYPPLVQVMLGVARDLSAEPRHVIFDLPRPILVAGQARTKLDVIHYCHDPSMAPPGKSAVQVWYSSNYDYWATLHQDEQAYAAEKRRVADLSIAELDRRWPGLAQQVEVVDVATPVTFERYTGNWQGSPDGWCITTHNMGSQLPQRLAGLRRFYMAGQWTVPFSGVPGAATSGCHAIQLLCHDDRKRFRRLAPPAVEAAAGAELRGMPVGLPPGPIRLDPSKLRRRSLANVLAVGHCAPTVMKTLLDGAGADAPWLVALVAGLPGGIGDSGAECGGITAPLVFLGLRHARDPDEDGVPVVVSKGRILLREFQARHGSYACRDLRLFGRLPLRCVGIVRRAPERWLAVDARPCAEALSSEERRACARLHAHFVEKDFHCAQAVLRQARGTEAPEPALLDAASAFVGGTAHAGLTCGALTAGVMLLGLAYGQSEHGPRRVLRAMAGMATGGQAFPDDVDAVNRAMDEGRKLATWFRSEFGSTQCRDVSGADFSSLPGVVRYVESDGLSHCREVARAVATRTRGLMHRA